MKHIGQGLAVGITAICCTVVSGIGIVFTGQLESLLIMIVPVAVAFCITIGDGWD